MTSRFLLEAFRPERPCWKLMTVFLGLVAVGPGCSGGGGGAGRRSAERTHVAVRDGAAARERQVELVVRRGDRTHAVAHQLGGGERRAVGRGGDAEGGRTGGGSRLPVEVVDAGSTRAQLELLDQVALLV